MTRFCQSDKSTLSRIFAIFNLKLLQLSEHLQITERFADKQSLIEIILIPRTSHFRNDKRINLHSL